MTDMLVYPAIYIRWHDAVHCDGEGWKQTSDIEKPMLLVETIGFLVYEDDDCYVVAVSAYPDWYAGEMVIPKGMVVHTQIIETEQPKAKKSEDRKGKRVASRTRR